MSEQPKPTGIEAAQAKLAQMKADGIEIQRLNPTEKALAAPESRHKAIRAMCYECLGGDDCPNIRSEIAYCTAWDCPLWHLRPHQQLCADRSLWPHKHLDRDNYGEPYGQEKRKAAVAAAQPGTMEGKLLLTAARKPASLAAAIRAKCWQCTGNSIDGVRGCPTWFGIRSPGRKYVGCPLHPVRPYRTGHDEPDTENDTEDADNDELESIE